MSEHAAFSPSAAHRWMNCPGSWRLSQKFQNVPTINTAMGTLYHNMMEYILSDISRYTGHVLDKLFNSEHQIQGFDVKVDEEMIEAIKVGCDFLIPLIREAESCELHIEHQVKITDDCWGTVDVVLDVPGKPLRVIDWKYGTGHEITAYDNHQLAIYAIGARNKFRKSRGPVIAQIVQPRFSEPIKSWLITPSVLRAWSADVLVAIDRCKQTPEERIIDESACRWCPAMAVCPEQQKLATQVAQGEFDEAELAPPNELSDEQLLKVITHAKQVKAWINKVEEHGVKRYLESNPIPGTKVVRGRSKRKWKSTTTGTQLLELGVKNPAEVVEKLKGITEVEKEIGKGNINHLVETPKGRLVLALYGDKRPAIEQAAEEEFD